MAYKDERDLPASHSSSERFTRADQGKEERLKRELEEKGEIVRGKDLKELQTKVNLQSLKGKVAKDQEKEDQKHETFGTKTIKELEEQDVETAQTKPTAERQIEKEKRQEEVEKQAREEYQGNVG